jgi:hypothetical protein
VKELTCNTYTGFRENLGLLALDTVYLLPLLPSLSAVKYLDNVDEVVDATRAFDNVSQQVITLFIFLRILMILFNMLVLQMILTEELGNISFKREYKIDPIIKTYLEVMCEQ